MKRYELSRYLAVTGGLILMALLHPMLQTCFSLFLIPVTRDMGVQRSAFSLCTSIVAMLGFLMSAQMGRWLSGKHARKVLLFCVLGLGASYASYGLAGKPIHLYVSAILVGLFSCGATSLPISMILTKWFPESAGTTVSVACAGSGIGGAVFTPVLSQLLENYGWQKTFISAGAAMMLLGIPTAALLLRFPKQKETETPGEAVQERQKTPKGLYRKFYFKIYLLGIFLMAFVAFAGIGQLSAYLTDRYSEPFSSSVLSFMLFCLTPAKIILGLLYDKKGIQFSTFYVQGACTISMLMLGSDVSEWLIRPMAIVFAVGNCCGTVSPPVLTSAIFGTRYYGPVLGIVNAACMLGNMVGPLAVSAMYDHFGSYRLAWQLCALFSLGALVCILFVKRSVEKDPAF